MIDKKAIWILAVTILKKSFWRFLFMICNLWILFYCYNLVYFRVYSTLDLHQSLSKLWGNRELAWKIGKTDHKGKFERKWYFTSIRDVSSSVTYQTYSTQCYNYLRIELVQKRKSQTFDWNNVTAQRFPHRLCVKRKVGHVQKDDSNLFTVSFHTFVFSVL